jgi:hypothetical protein
MTHRVVRRELCRAINGSGGARNNARVSVGSGKRTMSQFSLLVPLAIRLLRRRSFLAANPCSQQPERANSKKRLASMALPKLRLQSLLPYACTVITKRESTTGILRVSRLQEFLDSQNLRIARQAIDPGKPLRLACHYYVVHNFPFCYLVTSGARLYPLSQEQTYMPTGTICKRGNNKSPAHRRFSESTGGLLPAA